MLFLNILLLTSFCLSLHPSLQRASVPFYEQGGYSLDAGEKVHYPRVMQVKRERCFGQNKVECSGKVEMSTEQFLEAADHAMFYSDLFHT